MEAKVLHESIVPFGKSRMNQTVRYEPDRQLLAFQAWTEGPRALKLDPVVADWSRRATVDYSRGPVRALLERLASGQTPSGSDAALASAVLVALGWDR